MEAVKISNLSYKYPSADEYCLKNVSFSVSEGEVCAIVGPNVPRYEQKTLSIT